MAKTTDNKPTKGWKRNLKIGLIAFFGGVFVLWVVFYGYNLVADLFYKPKPDSVKAQRPSLGVIKLTPTHSPDGIPGWVAEFNLDAAPDVVWKMFRDCRNLAKALKGVHYCKTLEKGDDWEINYMALEHGPGWHIKQKTYYRPKDYDSHWTMISGSFTAAAGHMRVKPIPGRKGWSRMSYGYFIKINPLLPKRFERNKNKRAVRNMARQIQRYVGIQRAAAAKKSSH